MAAFALLLITALTVAVSPFRPWIGVLAYYVLALLFPQALWPWAFAGWRISYVVALTAILTFLGHLALRSVSVAVWRSRQTIALLTLWAAIAASHYFGAYTADPARTTSANPASLLEGYSKTFLFFLIAQPLLLSLFRIRYLALVAVGVAIYYTYWANAIFLAGDFTYFSLGRLRGPMTPSGASVYGDENAFAMLLVIVLPFLYFLAQHQRRAVLRWALYLVIPFTWHAVFLTGSRGGLLGLGIVGLHAIVRSRRRYMALIAGVALVVAFVTQGGVMKSRSDLIVSYEEDASANSRLVAWEAAIRMATDHPLFGVGLGRFMVAFPDYAPPDARPRVAHSSILHLAAESGVVAAGAFVLIWLFSLADLRRIRANAAAGQTANQPEAGFVRALSDAIEGGLTGFFVCGLFLNLQTYDIFYVLVLLTVCLRWVVAPWAEAGAGVKAPAPARPIAPVPAL